MKEFILSGLALLAAASMAHAEDFPTPSLFSPVMGVSNFTTVCIIWEYQDITLVNGRPEITITTPSGQQYSAKGYTEFVSEDDKGGSLDGSNTNGENALSVSYYNALNSFGEEITKSFDEKGIYTISVPEGCIAINGVPNPGVELTYDLGHIPFMEPATFEFTGENDSSILTITWGHQTLKKTRSAANGLSGSLQNLQTGTDIELFSGLFTLVDDNTSLQVNLSGSIFEDGDYAFVLPGNQLQNPDGFVNPDQTFRFTVGDAGIETVSSETSYSVLDLNGVKILETHEAAKIKTLPAGIYVINGKKVVLR